MTKEPNFTIKLLRADGREQGWGAYNWRKIPRNHGNPNAVEEGLTGDQVAFANPELDGEECFIDSGSVYVVNRAGNTVGTYHLGERVNSQSPDYRFSRENETPLDRSNYGHQNASNGAAANR